MRQAKKLLDKYRLGKATPEEVQLLQKWFHHFEGQENTELTKSDLESAKLLFKKYADRLTGKSYTRRLWPYIAAAASIILCTGLGFYFFHRDSTTGYNLVKQDILPGRDRATLALANGKRIDLDAIKNGTIIHQNGLTITKTNDGQLVYESSVVKDESAHSDLSYNTVETPRGGRYEIKLPDGTSVWLNAASSLKYPIQFTKNERRVSLTGEGYFEVVHDKAKPFRVESHGQVVEVIGTHFNVNTYADEKETKTTLLEGSVKISSNQAKDIVKRSEILKPGQQASLNNAGLIVTNVDADDAIAWQRGYFKFNRESIQSIMRKLSRWYNIDVVFETEIDPLLVFGGKISQTKNLQAVLKIMEETGNVHFRVEGRRVIVMK